MTHLDDDRLVDLALGSPAEAPEDAHITVCSTCAATFESIGATIRLTRMSGETVLVDPPARVWDSIQAELRGEASTAAATASATATASPSDTVTSLEDRRRRPRASTPTTWLLAAACVLGVVLGVGGANLANRIGGESDPTEISVASASLAPLDSPDVQGVASLVDRDGGLRLDLPAMDLDPGEGYLEVWLINRDLTRMVSVGVIPASATEIVLPISQQLIDEGYVIVDVSREPFDDQPAHSGETLVRGELSL